MTGSLKTVWRCTTIFLEVGTISRVHHPGKDLYVKEYLVNYIDKNENSYGEPKQSVISIQG